MRQNSSKYNASLQATGLVEPQRRRAEERYLALLEAAFGSASKVRGAYVEYVAVRSLRAEEPWGTSTPQELEAVARWEQAAMEASRAVFSEMKIADNDAFFELHVWNSRTS
jgi:hypothetical protein